jgi:hypothetical protein
MTGMDRSSFILLYSLDNIQNPRAGELKLGPILVRVGFMGGLAQPEVGPSNAHRVATKDYQVLLEAVCSYDNYN